MPKLKNPNKRQVREILDREQSAHTRSFGYCEKCGTRENLTNSHIISRAYIKVQFDPRNLQCLCSSCHGMLEGNPILFAEFVAESSCGKYTETIQQQGLSIITKPDYDLWQEIRNLIDNNQLNLEQAREWLGQKILWNYYDIPKL